MDFIRDCFFLKEEKMKKIVLGLLVLLLCINGVFAQGGGETPANPQGTKVVEVNWWTHWSGSMADPLKQMMEEFNASQTKYKVNYVYQGTSLDVLAKLQSTKRPDLPAVFTGPVEYVGYYAGCDFVLPIQDFIDKDKWDRAPLFPISQFAYSDRNNRLVGYPAGNSFPGMFVNIDMLKAAGIDAYKDLNTIQDVYDACKKIVDSGLAKHGIGFHNDAYWIAMTFSTQGISTFDKNDGYEANPTKCIYNEGKTKEAIYNFLSTIQKLYVDGYAIPYGTNINVELIPRFAAGEFPILQTTTGFFNKISLAKPNFEYALIPLFGCDDNRVYQGVPAGGCGWFICDNGNTAAQQGAYEFAKFMSTPERNAYWAMSTGYLPQTQAAVDTPAYQAYIRDVYPHAKYALQIQAQSNGSVRNPFIPIANEQKLANDIMLQAVSTNATGDINAAIDKATTSLTEAIQLFNISNN